MIFALPSAVIVLGARLAFYRVTDEDQRAARQVTILSFVVAALLCCILYAFILLALSSH